MKKRSPVIQLLLFTGLLIISLTSCNKNDNLGDDPTIVETVKDADGNKYNTIRIGTQIWTVENLKTTRYNDSTLIPNVTDSSTWSKLTTGAFSNYDNLESNATTYGRLYNWHAVNTGKLAPVGWHVPTDDDWTILENYLIANGYNYDSTKVVDKVAKSLSAKTNWTLSTNLGTPGVVPEKNNSSGFTALPGGSRLRDEGEFKYIGKSCAWWSSTQRDENLCYVRYLGYNNVDLDRELTYMQAGLSIRLVKD